MSDDVKQEVSLPVTARFEELKRGGDLTAVQVLNSLITSDPKNLRMIVDIDDVSGMAVGDLLCEYAKSKGYSTLSSVLGWFLKYVRENSCSRGGWRSKQIIEGCVAELERFKEINESLGERLGVKRGSR